MAGARRKGLKSISLRPGRGKAAPASSASGAPPLTAESRTTPEGVLDLRRRRDQLAARVAELQFDLGGLVYEMAIRDRMRVEILVQRAAVLQQADAELAEVERILRLEHTSTAGVCGNCGAPHSSGAAYCWQCGQPILLHVPSDAIAAH
ncbi:MAG TPA: zinc ribbon domain-containing protein [Solirubrobacteraceae bacterium]|nr:zinc ribbon domain-containing protein [Solirubrobacteraceae bacterium]